MIESMQTPTTRAEFERRFHLLKEQMNQGKLHFASESAAQGIHGIAKVRFLPNGRIDFLSVDESARSLANTSLQFQSEAIKEMINSLEGQNLPKSTSEHMGNPTD